MFSFNLVLPDAVRPVGEEARGARQNLAWTSLHRCEWQSSQLSFFGSSSHTSVSRGFRQRNSSVGGSGVGKAEGILGCNAAEYSFFWSCIAAGGSFVRLCNAAGISAICFAAPALVVTVDFLLVEGRRSLRRGSSWRTGSLFLMKWNITYVFFYIRQKPRRLQSVNQALYLNVEILQPWLPARVSWVESWYLTPSKAYQ